MSKENVEIYIQGVKTVKDYIEDILKDYFKECDVNIIDKDNE